MKIIDTLLFYNEFDLLELRFAEHYDHVDQFVILEFDRTFTGLSKPHILLSQKERYKKWWDKVLYVPLSGGPKVDIKNYSSAWSNEFWQFNQMAEVWKDIATEDDVVLMCCVDEIIRKETFDYMRNTNYKHYSLLMPIFYCKYNYVGLQEYKSWAIGLRGNFNNPRELRDKVLVQPHEHAMLHNAGWHFSYLGNETWIKNKLKSFSHTEVNTPEVRKGIKVKEIVNTGRDLFNRPGFRWLPVDLNDYFPKTLLENKKPYSDFIMPDSGNDMRSIAPYGYAEKAN
jgi:hypothetical protein